MCERDRCVGRGNPAPPVASVFLFCIEKKWTRLRGSFRYTCLIKSGMVPFATKFAKWNPAQRRTKSVLLPGYA